jgi:ubiquinone/menaquinone biosynthesis C-methylase UbiE
MSDIPLHQMNPMGRFAGHGQTYATYRPSYPVELIQALLAGISDRAAAQVVDVGAGTGISARLMADQGVRVIALEPNEDMRQAAIAHPGVEFRIATAEDTQLESESMDRVTAFQAFHWFNHRVALPEFHRILKPDGQLAVVWNDRDSSDPFTAGYAHVLRVASNYHPAEAKFKKLDALLECPLFANVRSHTFANVQVLDEAGLLGRALSVSYAPKSGEAYEELQRNLDALYRQHQDSQGFVYLHYRATLNLAQKR